MQWTTISAYSGAAAIVMGAFGAHALKGKVNDKMLNAWTTGAQYHLLHSAVMLALSLAQRHQVGSGSSKNAAPNYDRALTVLGIGTAVFSGSLYAMVWLNKPALGALTPIGGLALIAGWMSIAFS